MSVLLKGGGGGARGGFGGARGGGSSGARTAPARCYQCETDPERQRWLEPTQYCEACRPPESDPDYSVKGVMAGIVGTLDVQESGGWHLGSRWRRLIEAEDIKRGIAEAHVQGFLSDLEVNIITCRWYQGLSAMRTAAALNISKRSVERYTRAAKLKLRMFIAGLNRG